MSEANTAVEVQSTAPTDASVTDPVNVTAPPEKAQQAESVVATEDQTPAPEADATPDWFMADKYKSVEDQAKAYKDLSSKIGKNWGAPKDDYSIEGLEGVQKDDPLIANLAPALKEIGLSQDGFKQLVTKYQEANIQMVRKFEEQLKKELTENDVSTYNAVNDWMSKVLKPEEIEQVKNNWLMTPADFKLFNTMRLMAGPSSNVPNTMDDNSSRFESSRSVENDKIKYRKEIKQGLRVADKNFENDLAQRFRDAFSREDRARR